MKSKFYNSYSGNHGLLGHDENQIMKNMKWFNAYFYTNILEHLPKNRDAKILDLGCGYGKSLIALRERGYTNYFGVDISEQQISWAKGLFKIENCDQIDAARFLEDKNLTYDCVLAIDIFEHLELHELVDVCLKIYKSLKVNGKIIIQVPNGLSLVNPIVYGDITHIRAFTPDSIKQLLNLTDFSEPYEFYETFSASNLIEKIKKIVYKLLFKPIIQVFVFITYKRLAHSIYTNNFLAVAIKKEKPKNI